MPARKNRPNKHGTSKSQDLKDMTISSAENILARTLIKCEHQQPGKDHYVGWPDMAVAHAMAKRGLLRKGHLATGCFYLTDLFRRQFEM